MTSLAERRSLPDGSPGRGSLRCSDGRGCRIGQRADGQLPALPPAVLGRAIAGGAERHRGFKCPHCKLFVPESRGRRAAQPRQRKLNIRQCGCSARKTPDGRFAPGVSESVGDRLHAVLERLSLREPSSFFSVLFSICRIRSRVTLNARPTLPRGCAWLRAREAEAELDHLPLALGQRHQRVLDVLAGGARARPCRTGTRPSRPARSRRASSPPPRRSASRARRGAAPSAGSPDLVRRDPSSSAISSDAARAPAAAPAGARCARPCSASRPCARGSGSSGPCRRSPASRPGGSTRWRRWRT